MEDEIFGRCRGMKSGDRWVKGKEEAKEKEDCDRKKKNDNEARKKSKRIVEKRKRRDGRRDIS